MFQYSGPYSQQVHDSWYMGNYGNAMFESYMAGEGFIMVCVDGRGTGGRGTEFGKCTYLNIGQYEPGDQVETAKYLGTLPYVDKENIGIWGWSGGGSSTAHLMFKYPDIYSTGIAVAGVYSQYLYDTIYQERYMGLPSTNPEGYYNGSPINFAANLKGNLMLIHGTGDDNVHYQSMEMLVNELIKQNKIFSMLSYPMRAHGIYERENTTYHLYQSMLKYWLENLPAGGR